MSGPRYTIIPNDAIDQLEGIELKVLLVLGSHANNKGWCSVSQGRIAERLGRARETVNRAIKKLAELGYIEKRELSGPAGRTCFYRVILDRGEPDATQDLVVTPTSQPQADPVTPTSQPLKTAEGGCDCWQITGGVICQQSHNNVLLNEQENPSLVTARGKGRSIALDAFGKATRHSVIMAIDPDLAKVARQEGWLSRLVDFISLKNHFPDERELADLKRRAADIREAWEREGRTAALATFAARQTSVLEEINRAHHSAARGAA